MEINIEVEEISFTASDGWTLVGDCFTVGQPKVAILVSAGTGFPRRFYRHISAYLAKKGAVVLTYDYRGIGGSRGAHEEFLNIEYKDWGRFDTPAAIDALQARCGDLPIVHLAHSVGGHFLGLVENHQKIQKHAFLSIGTGYWGGHHKTNLHLEFFFWWIVGTYSLKKYGYLEQTGGWTGEPLPPKLFRQWRKWCHRKSYFSPEIQTSFAPSHYEQVVAPIRSWIFTDDPIATPTSAADLLLCYPNAPKEILLRKPSDFGLKKIGHDGAFRKGRELLWDEVWQWIESD